jgi:hypothetical protein
MVKQQGKDDIHLEVIYIITGKMWDQAGAGIYLFMIRNVSPEDGKA